MFKLVGFSSFLQHLEEINCNKVENDFALPGSCLACVNLEMLAPIVGGIYSLNFGHP